MVFALVSVFSNGFNIEFLVYWLLASILLAVPVIIVCVLVLARRERRRLYEF